MGNEVIFVKENEYQKIKKEIKKSEDYFSKKELKNIKSKEINVCYPFVTFLISFDKFN